MTNDASLKPSIEIPAGVWRSDSTHSTVGFAIRAVGTFRGTFADLEATLTVDGAGTATLTGSTDIATIVLKNDRQRAHLLSPDFFDAENHPEMRFAAGELTRSGSELVVTGELTIRGKTLPIQAHGRITEPTEALDGGTRLGIALETVIDRTEYGVSWNAPAPLGGMVLGNDVTVTIDLDLQLATS